MCIRDSGWSALIGKSDESADGFAFVEQICGWRRMAKGLALCNFSTLCRLVFYGKRFFIFRKFHNSQIGNKKSWTAPISACPVRHAELPASRTFRETRDLTSSRLSHGNRSWPLIYFPAHFVFFFLQDTHATFRACSSLFEPVNSYYSFTLSPLQYGP